MAAFREVLEDCNLLDLGFQGPWFTWERGNLPETNIRERLDQGNEGQVRKRPRFKFEAWWTLEESFEEETKKAWGMSPGMISKKLESLQHWLLRWASLIKYDRDNKKKELTEELGILLDGERNDDNMEKITETRRSLNMEIDKDEMLETEDGQEVTADCEISNTASRYFQKLFTSSGVGDSSHILEGITPTISSDINTMLQFPYSVDEVQKALKGMGPTKAPGYDGFPALFSQKYWHIVGKDVAEFCLRVLNEGKELDSVNRTDIVLIPKIPNPTSLVNFRPISLCIILYKLVAKTIANKLQKCIGKCIDSAQSAFVPGRLI
ncbi:reverse transcriptase [Gossypium australe]|uniref:Reverse transcriptase n=1 Tax=Gossypium australe TaxID=47621 RepID=A0A5B6WL86_9ROSI|nr:reverse transcriptase [Gossypium australe]